MKCIHFGEDYCKIQIGSYEFEVSKMIGESVNKMNAMIKSQRQRITDQDSLLLNYGRHHFNCNISLQHRGMEPEVCTCGFSKALEKARGEL